MQYIWNILAYIINNVLPPALMLILARILNPSDFGYFAVYFGFIGLIQGLFFTPLGEIIIKSESEYTKDYLFTIQTLLILVIGAGGWLMTSLKLVNIESQIIMAFCISLFLNSFVETSIKYSMRKAEYQHVFVRRLISPIGNAIVSIPLALYGWSYWSLVIGQISANSFTSLYIITVTNYPKIKLKVSDLKSEYSFGSQMLVQGFVKWLRSKADRVALGLTRTSSETGNYDLTRLLASLPFTSIVEPLSQVLYSSTARKKNKADIAGDYLLLQRRILSLSLPLFIFLMLNSKELIAHLLGEKYLAMNYYFNIFVLIGLCSTFVGSNIEYFKSISRPEIMTRFMIIRGIFTALFLLVSAPYGVRYLSHALLLLAVIFSPINIYITQQTMGNTLSCYFNSVLKTPLSVGMFYAMIACGIIFLDLSDLLQFIVSTILLLCTYILSLYLFEKDLFKMVRKVLY